MHYDQICCVIVSINEFMAPPNINIITHYYQPYCQKYSTYTKTVCYLKGIYKQCILHKKPQLLYFFCYRTFIMKLYTATCRGVWNNRPSSWRLYRNLITSPIVQWHIGFKQYRVDPNVMWMGRFMEIEED